MDYWNILEYGAWAISFVLFGWMLLDAFRVNRDFEEEVLTSSREGELEQVTEKHDID